MTGFSFRTRCAVLGTIALTFPTIVHAGPALGGSNSVPPTSAPTPTPPTAPSETGPNEEHELSEVEVRRIAAERFERGTRLFADGEYQLALLDFERAYESTGDYRVLYNIGQVRIQLERYAGAVLALSRYLRDGADGIAPERQATVAADLAMLAERTAHILVTTNVDGAEVLIDDLEVARSPMPDHLLVDAGEHRLTVRKPGYLSRTIAVAVAGRDNRTFDMRLTAEATEVAKERTVIVERVRLPEPAPQAPASHRTTYLWAGWLGTTILAGAAATSGLAGHAAYAEREDALQRKTSTGELARLETRAKHWFLAADILGALALATGGTTLYYTLTGPTGTEKPPPPSPHKAPVVPAVALSPRHLAVTLEGAF